MGKYHAEQYCGLVAFCELFYQNVKSDSDLLSLKEQFEFYELEQIPEKISGLSTEEKDKFQRLTNSIFEYLSGIKLNGINIVSDDQNARQKLFAKLGKLYSGNHFLASLGFTERTQEKETKEIDIFSFKHDDLLKLYCQKIYDREGTFEKAANFAGMAPSTFQGQYNKYVRGTGLKSNTKLKMS